MVFCCFAGIHVELVRGFRSGVGIGDVQRRGGFADVGEGEMDVAGDGVVLDHSLRAGLGFDAIVVFVFVRLGRHGYSTELAIEAVGPVKRDVVIGF